MTFESLNPTGWKIKGSETIIMEGIGHFRCLKIP
jgi:hypothetical protein